MSRPPDLPDRLRDAVGPVVDAAGLHLEDVSVTPAGPRRVVRVVVDLPDGPGGVDSDRLGEVSRSISAVLDDADLVQGAHTLEVSTPGADRPLTEPRHFRRAVGRLLRLRTADGRQLTARLHEAGEDGIVVEPADAPAKKGAKPAGGRREELGYAEVDEARVEIELKSREG